MYDPGHGKAVEIQGEQAMQPSLSAFRRPFDVLLGPVGGNNEFQKMSLKVLLAQCILLVLISK